MPATSRELQALLTAALESGDTHYRNAIAAQLEGLPSDRHWIGFRRTLARSLLLGQLIGAARVVQKAKTLGASFVFDDEPILADRFAKVGIDFGDGDESFISAEFVESIQSFQDRVPRLRREVDLMKLKAMSLASTITDAERQGGLSFLAEKARAIGSAIRHSFWASDSDIGTIVNLKAILADVMRGTATKGQMQNLPSFIDESQLAGASNLTRARLETIYRTNIVSAFNDGQAEILNRPEVQATIPLVMISEGRDRRTRGNPIGLYPEPGRHYQMHGYVNTQDEIDRQGLRPPNGYNCRGGLRPLGVGESRRMGLLDASGRPDGAKISAHNGERQAIIDRGEYPDPGFKIAS